MVIEMHLSGTIEKFDDSSVRQLVLLGLGADKWLECSD